MKKMVRVITWIAGAVAIVSACCLDSEHSWIPMVALVLSVAWLSLVAHATFER